MFSDRACRVDINAVSRFDRTLQSPVIRLDISQIELQATVLSRAFYDEPQFKFLLPDEETRRTLVHCLFRYIERSGQVFEKFTQQKISMAVLSGSVAETRSLSKV